MEIIDVGGVEYEILPNNSKKYCNGSIWDSTSSGKFTILCKVDDGYKSSTHFVCKFEDGAIVVSDMTSIKGGNIRSPNRRSYCNVGYVGQGKYSIWDKENKKFTREGSIWSYMIVRCYGKNSENSSYKFSEVCDRWKCFQNFCEDIPRLPNYDKWKRDEEGIYELDKDILCEIQNRFPKLYSPTTCMFVTKSENLRESVTRFNKYGSAWKYIKEEENTMVDLFKVAAKNKYRFDFKGQISVEDLFTLKVEDLDKIYKSLKSQQRNASEESLLQTVSKEDKELNNKIEIIKVIVEDKFAAKERAAKAAERKAQNQRILEIMADKQDAELKEKSLEELQAMLITDEDEE